MVRNIVLYYIYRVWFPQFLTETLNTAPDNYASAKVPFLHPSKLQITNNSNMSYNIPLLEKFITTFVIIVSQRSGRYLNNKILSSNWWFILDMKVATLQKKYITCVSGFCNDRYLRNLQESSKKAIYSLLFTGTFFFTN